MKDPIPLTENYLYALRAVALGKVLRTYNSMAFTLTGPCSSKVLWSLSRMHLIADPPGGPLQGRHRMVLTAKGGEILRGALGSDLRSLRGFPGKPVMGMSLPHSGTRSRTARPEKRNTFGLR
jgi:hypothetical protein